MPEFILEDEPAGFARIKVVGVGGGGCNAVDSMFDLGLQAVDFYVINTDLQALKRSKCQNRIQIGAELTQGRGCGADPSLGERCMEDAHEVLRDTLHGADIVFVTAGLGGGTGTGAAPVVARVAKEMGILTVCVVTKPFKFEGPRRMKSAVAGLEKIRESADTMIAINNERLLEVVGAKAAIKDAFAASDKVLSQAVQSISDLVSTPGLINVDFNDIRTIMGGRGGAVMGVGLGKGESRATEAVKKATNSPLLDKVVIDGATGILICITGGPDMTLSQISEATELVAQVADPDAEIIFGAVVDESMADAMRVTLIATGFSDELHRKREIERAFESAPVAGRRPAEAPPVARPATPAPVAVAESFSDEIDALPIFNDPAPVAELPKPAPAPQAETPRRPSLRDEISRMDAPLSKGGNGGARILREQEDETPAQPPIRVAQSRPSNGDGNVRPAPRPVVRTKSSEHTEEPTRRAPEEAVAKVAQYTPDKEEAREDFDQPAFLRRNRSLFD